MRPHQPSRPRTQAPGGPCLAGLVPLLVALAACGPSKTELPEPPIRGDVYVGTSSDDLWAISFDTTVAHWDGRAWTAPSGDGPLAPRGSPASFPIAATIDETRHGELVLPKARLLMVDAQGLFAIDAKGAVAEDFGVPPSLGGAAVGWTHVGTNGVAHIASIRVDGNPPAHHVFRYQDGTWTDLQAPSEVANFRVSPDGRVIAKTGGFAESEYLLYADGAWTPIAFSPPGLPRFFGDRIAFVGGGANQSAGELEAGVEWLDGDKWTRTQVSAGSFGDDEIFLSFGMWSLGGAPAVRYALRRISGSDRYREYGYLRLNDDLTFDGRYAVVESANTCSTACLGDYEDRTTRWWPLGDGSSVYGISAEPGADASEGELYVIDAP